MWRASEGHRPRRDASKKVVFSSKVNDGCQSLSLHFVTMQPVFANRSSLIPPDPRPALPSQAPAAPACHRSAQIDSFPSFQESDFMVVGGNMLQRPIWLPSDGQVDYASMMQHLFQAKRSLQVRLVLMYILSFCY